MKVVKHAAMFNDDGTVNGGALTAMRRGDLMNLWDDLHSELADAKDASAEDETSAKKRARQAAATRVRELRRWVRDNAPGIETGDAATSIVAAPLGTSARPTMGANDTEG